MGSSPYRAGYIAIIGKPNAGKSTLMNRLIGQKISITSHRPQTTRHRILGIYTDDNCQMVFVDTPGIHSLTKKTNRRAMNKIINKTAIASIEGVDLICMMITARGWTDADTLVLKALEPSPVPVILIINKIDKLKSVNDVLPIIDDCAKRHSFTEIVPVSATASAGRANTDHLFDLLSRYLPEQAAGFAEDQVTDRSSRFLVSELVREQLFRRLGDELPFSIAVEITEFVKVAGIWQIGADIWVEKDGHKAMVIGKQGEALKKIGRAARLSCEALLDSKVYLKLFVKVRSGWVDNMRDLHNLGYDEMHF